MVQAQDITTEGDPQRNSEDSRNASRFRRQRFGALAWILVLGLQLYWILWDIPILSPPSLPLGPTQVRPLGEMLSTQNEVRTQGANDVVWERAGSPSEVYSGSRVMTLEKAEAKILLRERGTLTLKENTLIALEGFETPSASLGSGKLKLLKGDLQLQVSARDRPMDLTLATPTGDRAIRVAPGSEIRSSRDRFEVIAGTVTDLETQASFNGGQTIEIRADAQGRAVLEPIVRPSPSPEPEPSPTPSPSPTPAASPKASPKPKTKPAAKPAIKKPKPAPKKALPAPKLKAPAIRKKKSATLRRSLFDWVFPSAHAEPAKTPSLYEPLEIDLTWEPVPEARGYRLQIAKDRGFKRVILDREVSRPPFTWDYEPGMENSQGRIFYRVSALTTDPATSSQFSVAEALTIPKAEPVVAAPPPPPAPKPTSVPKSIAIAKPAAPETTLAIGVAIRKFTQQSTTRDLEDVTENSPYFHQTFRASHSRPKIRADLELRYTQWTSDSTRHASQSKITSLDGTVSSSRWALTRWGRSTLRWELGALIARATRFEKNSRSTIEVSPGYAFGAVGALALDGWRAKLTLPVSGLLFGSYWGAEALLEKEIPWGNFFLLPEARYALQTWDTPKDTEVREWSAGASLGYRF